MAVIAGRGELGADLVSLGGAEIGVDGEGLLPVAAGLAVVTGGVVSTGVAVVGAGLLVLVADLDGQSERGGVLDAGRVGLAGSEEHFTKAVERFGFSGLVTCLTGQG